MIFDNLVIEITRRCNMSCSHCLRGDAQNLDTPLKYITYLFDKTDQTMCLTITGGEPSLVPSTIDYIASELVRKDVEVGFFYMATNGLSQSPDFVSSIAKLYSLALEPDVSMLNQSIDIYHDPVNTIYKPIEMFKFYGKRSPDYNKIKPMQEGRLATTYENYLKTRQQIIKEIEINDDGIVMGDIYLNAKGNIIAGCDFSYESQDREENIICRVEELSIDNISNFIEKNRCIAAC